MRIHIDFQLSPEAKTLIETELPGHEIRFSQQGSASVLETGPPDEQVLEAEVVFGQPDPGLLLQASNLKFVQISTSGITRYDSEEFRQGAKAKGLTVCNSAHVYNEACAEHVFSFLLAQSRNLPEALTTRDMGTAQRWVEFRSHCVSLQGQTLLIVGYGAIGKRLVELLTPFRMNLSAFRRHPRGSENIRILTQENELAAALSEADHVVNILPQHPRTEHFFNKERFATFKPGAVFYNIGRGGTVHQPDLIDALDNTILRAAWLDVTDPEPLPEDHPLWLHPKVYLTPHVAGGHAGESFHLAQYFVSNLKKFMQNEQTLDQII